MKIQEMRSGILHLSKKVENERRENVFKMRPADEAITDAGLPLAAVSELDEPRWSVISFDRREAGGLTYRQAVALMFELDAHNISGLCVVTAEAAARLRD